MHFGTFTETAKAKQPPFPLSSTCKLHIAPTRRGNKLVPSNPTTIRPSLLSVRRRPPTCGNNNRYNDFAVRKSWPDSTCPSPLLVQHPNPNRNSPAREEPWSELGKLQGPGENWQLPIKAYSLSTRCSTTCRLLSDQTKANSKSRIV